MYYLGYDIGGTKCAVSLGKAYKRDDGSDGIHIIGKAKFPTADESYENILNHLAVQTEILLDSNLHTISDVSGIGISCGGPLDTKRGVILSPPNLPKWNDVHITDFFENRYGIKTRLQNDANACAVAEWKFGSGQSVSNMIFLTFGTGLGAGLILDGRLYCGKCDMAGEIGHIRLTKNENAPTGYGKRGSAESFCSGGGIAQIGVSVVSDALAMGEHPLLWNKCEKNYENITAKLIADLADEGDKMCISIYRLSGQRLGEILSILIDTLNPELIAIGGIFMRSPNLLLPDALDTIKHESLSYSASAVRIVPAALGENIGDYAALSVAAGEY